MSSGWERVRLRVETKEYRPQAKSIDMRTISSHVLDTSVGLAAANVTIKILRLIPSNGQWQEIGTATTNEDGRVSNLLDSEQFQSGIYKLHFDVKNYFQTRGVKSFYPFIEIIVECVQGQHYHIPLLLNPFGYSTYRGT